MYFWFLQLIILAASTTQKINNYNLASRTLDDYYDYNYDYDYEFDDDNFDDYTYSAPKRDIFILVNFYFLFLKTILITWALILLTVSIRSEQYRQDHSYLFLELSCYGTKQTKTKFNPYQQKI